MANNVSEKHSTSIFWTETKFNYIQALLPWSQEEQNSSTSLNSIKQEVICFHHCKTSNVACPTRSCQKTF